MSVVELLVRNRFVSLPGATARRGQANAWELVIPRDEAVARLIRGPVTLEAFDGATFAIDGVESLQAIGAGEDARVVRVTALMP